MLTVVCLKWGTAFPPVHVNVLYQAVKRNLSIPFRFVCLTDHAEGIADGIEYDADSRHGPARRSTGGYGCWAKLSIFKRGLFPDADVVMYFDLDLIVQAPLEPFVERVRAGPAGCTSPREWNPALWSLLADCVRPDRGAQGAFMAFRPEDMHYVYDNFMADQDKAYALAAQTTRVYLTRDGEEPPATGRMAGASASSAHASGTIRSIWFSEKSSGREAPRSSSFTAMPRPWHLIRKPGMRWGTSRKFGYQPVEWVKDYYRLAGVDVD